MLSYFSKTNLCGNCGIGHLRSVRVFYDLHAQALADYQLIGVNRSFANGKTLFWENAQGIGVFIILAGQVKLFCTSREGRIWLTRIATPGDVLGLSAVISESCYEVTAETILPTRVKYIQRNEFLFFLQRHGEASLQAAESLSEDYEAALFNARRLAISGTVAGRLAGLLLDWGRAAATGNKVEMRFTMVYSREELANLVGSSRESVTRALGSFKKDNLIQMRDSSVLIISPDRLERLSA